MVSSLDSKLVESAVSFNKATDELVVATEDYALAGSEIEVTIAID